MRFSHSHGATSPVNWAAKGASDSGRVKKSEALTSRSVDKKPAAEQRHFANTGAPRERRLRDNPTDALKLLRHAFELTPPFAGINAAAPICHVDVHPVGRLERQTIARAVGESRGEVEQMNQ